MTKLAGTVLEGPDDTSLDTTFSPTSDNSVPGVAQFSSLGSTMENTAVDPSFGSIVWTQALMGAGTANDIRHDLSALQAFSLGVASGAHSVEPSPVQGESSAPEAGHVTPSTTLQSVVEIAWSSIPEAQPDFGYLEGRMRRGCRLHPDDNRMLMYSEQALRDEPHGTGVYDILTRQRVTVEQAVRGFEPKRYGMRVPSDYQSFAEQVNEEQANKQIPLWKKALASIAQPLERFLRRSKLAQIAVLGVALNLSTNILTGSLTEAVEGALSGDTASDSRQESRESLNRDPKIRNVDQNLRCIEQCREQAQAAKSEVMKQFWMDQADQRVKAIDSDPGDFLDLRDGSALNAAAQAFLENALKAT